MSFALPDLPYERDALEPHISARTMDFHYGKHHRTYIDKLNKAIEGSKYDNMPLEEVIQASYESEDTPVFNNAAQAWNHTFFWDCMKAGGGGAPAGDLAERIDKELGGLDGFRTKFKEAATGQFGSGWAWLTASKDGLAIVPTPNAHSPLTSDATPLITLDVWEHAYYLDYQNARDRFVDVFLEHLLNWDFAARNLEAFESGARPAYRASQ